MTHTKEESTELRLSHTARTSAPTTSSEIEPRPPAKRKRTVYDLRDTFEVIVGEAEDMDKSFILHTHVFANRTSFFSGLFIEQFILHGVARKLDDYKTANVIIAEIIRFSNTSGLVPAQEAVQWAHTSLTGSQLLRKLVRDLLVCEAPAADSQRLRAKGFPGNFIRDLAVKLFEMTRMPADKLGPDISIEKVCKDRPCRYHLHNETHPRCTSKRLEDVQDPQIKKALEVDTCEKEHLSSECQC